MSAIRRRDVVDVSGPDAGKYLQGQLSQDVLGLAVGDSAWSFLLEPSGKLGFVLRVQHLQADIFRLDIEPGQGDAVEARLRRFLIRTKATLTRDSLFVDVAPDAGVTGRSLTGWWGQGAHLVAESAHEGSETDAELARVAAGWPGIGELTEGIIPAETGLVELAANFKKGCYTGQELVARVDSRGNHAPHHLERIVLTAPAAVGSMVTVGGADAGILTSVAGLQALAYIRRSVVVPADAVVDGHPAQVVSQRV